MKYLILSLAAVFLHSCQGGSNVEPPQQELTPSEQREALIQQNVERLRFEREMLKAYSDSSGIDWTRTGTGLQYYIYEAGDGAKIQEEDIIEMDYTLTLLDGFPVSSSEENGPFMMRVNKDNDAVLGMHEATLLMHKGDSAAILIPSHLAWGIAGDMDKIPPITPVLYHVRIHD